MKKQIWIILLIFFSACKSSEIVSEESLIGEKFEPGKCYYSVQKIKGDKKSTDFYSNGFLLEITETKYKVVKKKLTPEELNNYPKHNNSIRLQTKNPSYEYFLKKKPVLDFLNKIDTHGLILCAAEVPAHYRTITHEELKQNNYIYDFEKIKTPQQILKIETKSKPKVLKENQFYFGKGNWSGFKEVVYPSHGPRNQIKLVEKIQTKLKELGYDIEVNNVLDLKTKKALLDFQIKNNLVGNQVNFETLKALGIEY